MIDVHLFGKFRKIAKNASATDESVLDIPWIQDESIEMLLLRLGLDPKFLGEVFINHSCKSLESYIPQNSRVSLFPVGMHLLCGGQHLKGHGFITKKSQNLDYYQPECDDDSDRKKSSR